MAHGKVLNVLIVGVSVVGSLPVFMLFVEYYLPGTVFFFKESNIPGMQYNYPIVLWYLH
jgi:hypothetical protein